MSVIEPLDRPDLGLEPLDDLVPAVIAEIDKGDLERHVAAEGRVVRGEHDSHAAGTQVALEQVPALGAPGCVDRHEIDAAGADNSRPCRSGRTSCRPARGSADIGPGISWMNAQTRTLPRRSREPSKRLAFERLRIRRP